MRKEMRILSVLAAMLLIIAIFAGCAADGSTASESQRTDANSAQTAEESASASAETTSEASAQGAPAGDYTPTAYADIQIKGYEPIVVGLDANVAPKTVENFIDLAESGFYDGLTFHRIMDGFMMQGGDPAGNGTGGSDKNVEGEFEANGVSNPFSHTRGAISMARSQDYNSASSQFFIVQSDSQFLDGEYAAFGYVEDGMDVVDAICAAAQPIDGNGTISPEEQPVIESITIREA